MDAKSYLPSMSLFIKVVVGFIAMNALLDLVGGRDWFYAPITTFRNRKVRASQ